MTNSIKMNNLLCVPASWFWFSLLVAAALARPIPRRGRTISRNSYVFPGLWCIVSLDLTCLPVLGVL